MTQVLTRAAATGTAGAPAVAARQLDLARGALRTTPGRLRLAAAATVLASLGFAVLGGLAFQTRADALSDARDHAAQIVRLQSIASDVVQADSSFTNGYLSYLDGQAETSAQLSLFAADLSDAAGLITQASQAEPADEPGLATVNEALRRYSEAVTAARDNIRQGRPVATGYLRQAGWFLSGSAPVEAIPTDPGLLAAVRGPSLLLTITALVLADRSRVADSFATSQRATWLLVAAGVLGLGVLVLAQAWLARLTRRLLNLPLVAATLAVIVALLSGGVAMALAQSSADDVKAHAYAATQDLATARITAYLAKSSEGLTLVYLGFGGAVPEAEKSYADDRGQVTTALEAASASQSSDVGLSQLKAWDTAHASLIAKAQSDWTSSLGQATSEDSGDVNATFAAFDNVVRPLLDDQAARVSSGLVSGRTLLLVLGWLSVALGVLAAAASWWGFSQRLGEYR